MTAGPASAAETLPPWQDVADLGLTLESLSGDAVSLADHGDQVVLVHFFATWCEPCREELSSLDRLARSLEGRPFAVLAVDSGEPEARIRRFFEEFPVSFPILLDPDRAALTAWDVTTLPTSFVLGPDARPQSKAEGDVAWDSRAVVDVIEAAIARSGGAEDRVQAGFETIEETAGEVR